MIFAVFLLWVVTVIFAVPSAIARISISEQATTLALELLSALISLPGTLIERASPRFSVRLAFLLTASGMGRSGRERERCAYFTVNSVHSTWLYCMTFVERFMPSFS